MRTRRFKRGSFEFELYDWMGTIKVGNFRVEWFKANTSGWINDVGYFSRVVGFGGFALHLIPDTRRYESTEKL